MMLIEHPTTLAERIVNAVVADLYGRSGGDHWFDGIDNVRRKELIPELIAAVQREIDAALSVVEVQVRVRTILGPQEPQP